MTCDHLPTSTAPRDATADVSSVLADPGRAAVIINPTKFARGDQLLRFRTEVEEEFTAHGWRAPLWLPTTATTLGRDEARTALAAAINVVLVAGGDGTIRAVAGELIGTGVPLGLLPVGTGNLLARNLGVPLGIADAVRLACEGGDRPVSVGWLQLDRTGDGSHTERHLFLVMAGAGFDAAMIAGASPALKRHLGHGAYLVAGARSVARTPSPIQVSVDGQSVLTGAAHGVVVGNCGTLTLGLSLMPDADLDDDLLDGVILRPQNPAGWAKVAWTVASRDIEPQPLMPRLRGRSIDVRSEVPQPVQVDGDLMGEARQLHTEVQPAALLVRCVAPVSSAAVETRGAGSIAHLPWTTTPRTVDAQSSRPGHSLGCGRPGEGAADRAESDPVTVAS
jgi:diacylglycerol kinase (ATP)